MICCSCGKEIDINYGREYWNGIYCKKCADEMLSTPEYIKNYKRIIADLQAENAALRERLEKAVELPLECGSIVWYLNTQPSISLKANTVYEGKLMRYHLSLIGGKVYFIADIQIKNDYGVTELPQVEKDFGKIWFTAREAAEARLAELKGDTK